VVIKKPREQKIKKEEEEKYARRVKKSKHWHREVKK